MARAPKGKRRLGLRAYIAILFFSLLLISSFVLLYGQHQRTRDLLLTTSDTVLQLISARTRDSINNAYRPAVMTTQMLAQMRTSSLSTLESRLPLVPIMAQALQSSPDIGSIYLAYDTGDFFQLRRIQPDGETGKSLDAPANAVYVVQSRSESHGQEIGRYIFYDSSLTAVEMRDAPDYVYDPRGQTWFDEAMATRDLLITPPYLFFSDSQVGVTFAQRGAYGGVVAAVDVTLAAVSDTLHDLKPTPGSQMFIFNGSGEILATAGNNFSITVDELNVLRLPRAGDMKHPLAARLVTDTSLRDGRTRALNAEGDRWQTTVTSISPNGRPLFLAIATPQSELLTQADAARNRGILTAVGALLIALVLTWLVSGVASRPIIALTGEAQRARALDFDDDGRIASPVLEINDLSRAMSRMKATIRRFLSLGQALASEHDLNTLLDHVLRGGHEMTGGRGGVIFLVQPDKTLVPIIARIRGQRIKPPMMPIDPDRDADHPAVRALREGSVHIPALEARLKTWYPDLPLEGTVDVISVPLRTHGGEALGVLIMGYDDSVFHEASPQDVISMLEAVASTAAVSIETQRLIQEQKALLESFIQLLASAIDAKSPYTGGHCQRVPELAKMLTHAVIETDSGPLAGYHLNADQWEELRIAAWLHDCGKVTTPEYVVDKSTKLETIYDRIHEIRTRFEVIKREAEAQCWHGIADGAPREDSLHKLTELWRELDEEFAFVARCNHGGESMTQEDIARLHTIAQRTWTRTLDDRLGVSHEELERKGQTAATPLPIAEPLLADRPDHIIVRPPRERIEADNPWGFKMDVPEHLYDRGELHNLSITRGTLTEEERYKINEHIVETIRMLSRLPFPRYLSKVVDIAGSHHEKLDGTGYPRRLTGEQMGTRARIMAIADIFEALTAADRPYKTGKPLSEAIAIMAHMRDARHIDADLFAVFLSAGVYLDYAKRFLAPEQIDEVDVARYVPGLALA